MTNSLVMPNVCNFENIETGSDRLEDKDSWSLPNRLENKGGECLIDLII